MIALFFVGASCAVFGLDFGHEYIKVGMAIPGRGVHVALNQQSKRLSPSYFSMWNTSSPAKSLPEGTRWTVDQLEECTWAFLDSAKSHSLRFPHNGIRGMSPVLGTANGFSRRESLALLLRHLVSTVDEGRWSPETAHVVIAVEPYLPRDERRAIIEAVEMSGATMSGIIDSTTAAAQLYALEKRALFVDRPKNVVFVDIGASATWAAVHRFENEKSAVTAYELAVVTNVSLGGNQMDMVVTELLIQQFAEQNKIPVTDVTSSVRLVRRFTEEARRAKELLTINRAVDVKMEDVIDDYGFVYKLTREEFEERIPDFGDSLMTLWSALLDEANLTNDEIDSIELIGGGTRVPFVQEALRNASGLERLNRTLNSDEAVALGAGYVGAAQSSTFIVMKTHMAPFANAEVSLIHDGKEINLFGVRSRMNETANYTYDPSQMESGMIKIMCDGTDMGEFSVEMPENLTEVMDCNVTVVFGFDQMTMPTVLRVIINETAVPVNLTTVRPDWMWTHEDFEHSVNVIHRMDEILDERHKFAELHNDYESYIYKIKDKLSYDPVFQKVVNETDRDNLTQIADSHQQWLFGEHETPLNISLLRVQLNMLKDATHPAEHRASEYLKRAPAFQELNNTLNEVLREMNETWPQSKPWLTENQTASLWRSYNRSREWFDEKYAQQLPKKEWEDPVVSVSEIETQKMLIEWNYKSTNKIKEPTPTPTPEPESTEELDDVLGDEEEYGDEQEDLDAEDGETPHRKGTVEYVDYREAMDEINSKIDAEGISGEKENGDGVEAPKGSVEYITNEDASEGAEDYDETTDEEMLMENMVRALKAEGIDPTGDDL